jgi:hypothetical protein
MAFLISLTRMSAWPSVDANTRVAELDLFVSLKGDAGARQFGFDADRRLVVDKVTVDHGVAIGIGEDRLAEDLHRMQGRGGGKADFDRVKVL